MGEEKREETCGLFLVDRHNRILICHPTGRKNKIWSIPKGTKEEGEDDLDAALRETWEETNITINKEDLSFYEKLNPVVYKHGKKVLKSFYIPEVANGLDFSQFGLKCNEYVKPKKGKEFPEIDDYYWAEILEAKDWVHDTQSLSLSQLNGIIWNHDRKTKE